MGELLSVLMAWLVATSDLPATDETPQIAFVEVSEMAEARRRRVALRPGQDGSDLREHAGRSVHAFYEDATRTIHLARTWRADSPAEVSILVHELVHHIQNAGGLEYPCAAARELPAYRAQARWLETFGMDLGRAFDLDPMTLLVRTRCMH